ncbi:hypothetical protein BCR44DRAFT_1483802 [Catenaria anguillulae PL171]|uniref:Uncharacterized protein n=1 Tax=Catenaria anguillulae PL171 TaxID=765915 RepID=A0A1Y2HX48_9FUNG|nr:hypothetical protein BCR44DRAFT_1483802 [Catenaria anguillulae PL171]
MDDGHTSPRATRRNGSSGSFLVAPSSASVDALDNDLDAMIPPPLPLPHELIEAILISTAHLIFHQRRSKATKALTHPIQAILKSPHARMYRSPPAVSRLVSHLLLVTHDLEPVHRLALPLLSHAWPPPIAATNGRLDALEHARQLQLLPAWLAHDINAQGHGQGEGGTAHAKAQARRLALMVEQATHHGHAHVLRWIQQHWPETFVACVPLVMDAVAHMIVSPPASWTDARGDRGADMLEYWVVESGVHVLDQVVPRALIVMSHAWWVDHLDVLGEQGARWHWVWTEELIHEAGTEVEPEVVRLADRLVDLASQFGAVELLERWVERQRKRGLPLVYSDAAMDACESVRTLDWWVASGLPLKYSHAALHRATAERDIEVLDWWLAAYRNGSISELKYTPTSMALASLDCKFDHSIYKHAPSEWSHEMHKLPRTPGLDDGPNVSRENTLAVLNWWTGSGLDLKLPNPSDDHLDQSCPSPIDCCMDIGVLEWWLDRAKRLHAVSPDTTSLHDHFPNYSPIAMHRAAYWNLTDVLDWWMDTAKAAGLEPRFHAHRMVELSAMTPWLRQVDFLVEYSSLAWCLNRLDPVRFRGRLLEWVAASHSGDKISDKERARAIKAVKQFCRSSKQALDLENGGMPPPERGYCAKEQGEDVVYFSNYAGPIIWSMLEPAWR